MLLVQGIDYTIDASGNYTFAAYEVGQTVTIAYQAPSAAVGVLAQMGLSLAAGNIGQGTWGYLQTNYPAQALGYSGLSYLYAPAYELGSNAEVANHSFEVSTPWEQSFSVDADPGAIITDILTAGRYGANFPPSALGSMAAVSLYARAQGLQMSPVLATQKPAAEWLAYILQMCNSDCIWSQGKLKMLPLGDAAVTGNGVTYTPVTTPRYDITEDHLVVASPKDEAVSVARKANEDAFNHVRVEYFNRANQYNTEIVEAKDAADIDQRGLRTMETVEAHALCEASAASALATLLLGKQIAVRNTYKFKLPWVFGLLEPLDLLTLTYAPKGLLRTPVRINKMDELDSGEFEFECEDAPIGMATAPAYGPQAGSGFSHDYNVAPGNVATPVFFEVPVELTLTGLEVRTAVSGLSANWGGCGVWASLDGNTYRRISRVAGGCRYGTLSAGMTDTQTTAAVVINGGQIMSGTAADAAVKNTLCWVDGPNGGEYFNYATATLTGAGAYTLSGLVRNAYTTPVNPHMPGAGFVRVDAAVSASGPMDLSMIGRTLYMKFTSFNVYGGAEQSLADVAAYPYLVTGAMAKLAPAALASVAAVCDGFGIRVTCAKSLEPDVVRYEYRQGASWATGAVLEAAGGTTYLWPVQAFGTYTFWVAPVDAFGNYGPAISAAITVAGGAIATISSAIVGEQLLLQWTSVPGSFAIAGYEVRFGATWAGATVVDFRQTSSYAEAVKWGGARVYWIAAIDVKNNYGTPASLGVSVNLPGAVLAPRAEVIDNNALLYWSPPAVATGQLPINRYEVRKGASWAAGTVVGSNGNSTFAAIFEQSAGNYVYWVSAVDTGGNIGAAVGIAASISQPPDYVLRSNYDSAMAGTWVNFYQAGAARIGPVDTTQTWLTHYSSNAWATPADQVAAGFPIYAEPSLASGSYEEIIDYGAAIPATIVTATLNSLLVAGTVGITCTLSWKLALGDAWTVLAAGTSNALIPPFRYVRVHYDFAGTAGANLLQINGLNVKLAIKARSDSGTTTAAVGGSAVLFSYPFLSADTPLVQPGGTTPLIPVVIYAGTTNPTGFSVKLYNLSGTDVGGTFSWTVRGY
jgi:Putative phage tail protein